MTRRPVSIVAGLAACAVCALLAAGCGGGSKAAASGSTSVAASTTTGTTTTTGGGRFGAGFAAFRSCLAAHGVALPSGGGFRPRTGTGSTGTGTTPARRPGGFQRQLTAKQRAAFTACRKSLPAGGFGARGQGRFGGRGAAGFTRYRQCLRAHGVTGTGTSAATLQKAVKACRAQLPSGGSTTTTTSG